jgi:hypothetical protein
MAAIPTAAAYEAIEHFSPPEQNNHVVENDPEAPLLGRKPDKKSWWRRKMVVDVRRDWADLVLLACYIITGILDSASISTWGAFVSMQTGTVTDQILTCHWSSH